jgi:hypothetical protein
MAGRVSSDLFGKNDVRIHIKNRVVLGLGESLCPATHTGLELARPVDIMPEESA